MTKPRMFRRVGIETPDFSEERLQVAAGVTKVSLKLRHLYDRVFTNLLVEACGSVQCVRFGWAWADHCIQRTEPNQNR